jgi:chloramphenicol-sensitive protein RarD
MCLTGVVTAVPLLLFAGAARRLPLTAIGIVQYLTPLMQFLIGVFLLHEALPLARLIGFILVWIALILLAVDGIRQRRSRARTPTPIVTTR